MVTEHKNAAYTRGMLEHVCIKKMDKLVEKAREKVKSGVTIPASEQQDINLLEEVFAQRVIDRKSKSKKIRTL
ncbi:hypothetical protein VCHA38O209_50269 [Vibrio chagasii]|nr:hypothetical protein VCHA38O209_50269 [Vibrio chagasii]